MAFIKHIRNFYARFERPISSLSLVSGFVFDALTLRQVDALWDNVWVVAHLLIVGFFMGLIQAQDSQPGDEHNPEKKHFWYVNIVQFFFGGILSTYLVFYFRSADILVTWPFILILAAAFVANESLKKHYTRLIFQISLYFLCLYSFAIFLVPVLMHKIGIEVFLVSGLVALLLIGFFILTMVVLAGEKFKRSRKIIFAAIFGITAVINILYFANLIPPIPLSLKDGDIYHSLSVEASGKYLVQDESHGFFGYFELYPDFQEVPGGSVYAFSAVFSPADLNLTILHEWQHYDAASGKWQTEGTVRLQIVGGRTAGFRTFSMWPNPAAGLWRVNVETESGQLIGRLRFNVVPVSAEPVLLTEVR